MTQVPYSVLLVWLVGPALVLTIFGIVLFRRYRTLPSALVALGFAAVFLSGLVNVIISYECLAHLRLFVEPRACRRECPTTWSTLDLGAFVRPSRHVDGFSEPAVAHVQHAGVPRPLTIVEGVLRIRPGLDH